MALTDPLGDMLARIRQGQKERKDSVVSPASKLRARVLDVLTREGYIRGYSEEALPGKGLRIELKYFDGGPAIKHVARVSKPGRRVYSDLKELPTVRNGLGIRIISEPSLNAGGLHVVQSVTTLAPAFDDYQVVGVVEGRGTNKGFEGGGATSKEPKSRSRGRVKSKDFDKVFYSKGKSKKELAQAAIPHASKSPMSVSTMPDINFEGLSLTRAVIEIDDVEIDMALHSLARAQGGTDGKVDISLAKALGFLDIETLRQALRDKLETEASELSAIDLKRQLFNELADRHSFVVPDPMIDFEAAQLWAELHQGREGQPIADTAGVGQLQLGSEYRTIAERRVRLGIVLALIGQQVGIEVSEAEAKAMLVSAGKTDQTEAQAWQELLRKDPRAVDELRGPLFEDKVVAFLLEHADVRERIVTLEALQQKIDEEIDPNSNAISGEANTSARLKLLDQAMSGAVSEDAVEQFERSVLKAATELLGGQSTIGLTVLSSEEVLSAIMQGFPSDVLNSLNQAGWSHDEMERVIAPRRTLMRRKAERARLKRDESDGAWRLAYTLALASEVLRDRDVAFDWLKRPKQGMFGLAPLDLLTTSVGTEHVQGLLRKLEWGDLA